MKIRSLVSNRNNQALLNKDSKMNMPVKLD